MKKLFTLLFATFSFIVNVYAQSASYDVFPIEVSNGLASEMIGNQYRWRSPQYIVEQPVDGIRITFLKTNASDSYNGYPVVALSELHFFDNAYNELTYTVGKITTNSLEQTEGALEYLYDNDWTSYYHSTWLFSEIEPQDYVYLDIKFSQSVSSFNLYYVTRNETLVPTHIVITPSGTAYDNSTDETGGTTGNNGGNSSSSNGGTGSSTTGDISYKPIDVFNDSIYFVYLANGGVDAIQTSIVDSCFYAGNDTLCFIFDDGGQAEYAGAEYDSLSLVCPQLPEMVTYKFNNKYNPNLNVDAFADTLETGGLDTTLNFSLNAIGKYLTASFNLSDDKAVAYVDSTLQVSKESRMSFADSVHYVVTYPGYNIVQNVKVSDEIWTSGEESVIEIPLTEDMLYTNKPSQVGDDLSHMLDNDPSTVFHTVYGTAYDASVMPYITITLNEPVNILKFYYMTRNFGNYNPMVLNLYVADDGADWKLVKSFSSTNDGLPLDPAGAEFTSPAIDLGGSYKYIKLEQTASEYHNNHMVFAEFRLYEVIPGDDEPTKIQDAEYKRLRVPFGRVYTVDVDWLTDGSKPVPRMDIHVEGGYKLIHNNKDIYRDANFKITGYGVYDDFEDSMQIKGRGNTSWSWSKKPYRLKFPEKVKPFGLTKGKSWVLLSNHQRGALMANAIAMKIGQLIDAPCTNHIIPVELYMDDTYVGSYMFTEKVGFSNNSVDVDEATGYMLELDSYYDETYKFYSSNYRLPVNLKEPDLTEYLTGAEERFRAIESDFNEFEAAVYAGADLEPYADLDALARFMFTNDLVLNQELGHPKSTFLWKENLDSKDSKIVFGPLWDFDWAFGYEGGYSYCNSGTTSSILSGNMYSEPGYQFFQGIMNNESFKKHYYKVWREFFEKGHVNELIDYLDEYFAFAKTSFENNAVKWSGHSLLASDVARMQTWLRERHQYLLNNVDEYDITELIYTLLGDVNCDNVLTIEDVALLVDYLNGGKNNLFNRVKADVDANGAVESTDVMHTASQLLAAEPASSLYYYNTPVAQAVLSADDFSAAVDEQITLPIALTELGNEQYTAYQMDIKVPAALALVDIVAGDRTSKHNLLYNPLSEDTYRVVVYSDDNSAFAAGDAVAELKLAANGVAIDDDCALSVTNVLIMNNENGERRINDFAANFSVGTSISTPEVLVSVKGGDCLTISVTDTELINVYAVDGRLVKALRVDAGTTRVDLPAGIYIVKDKKVIIH